MTPSQLKQGDRFFAPPTCSEAETDDSVPQGTVLVVHDICDGDCRIGYSHLRVEFPNGGIRDVFIGAWVPIRLKEEARA